MKVYSTKDIRNIGLIGHGGEGKTSLTEAMLFNANASDRFGKVDAGTTTTDYDTEEHKRQISISASLAPLEWNNTKLNILDIPGYFDFVGELVECMRVVDSAVIVLSAVSGLSVGAEKGWDSCIENKTPRAFFINQMDRENANFDKVLTSLQTKYGSSVVPFQFPIMEGGHFTGIIDIIDMKAYKFEGTTPERITNVEIDIPAELGERIEEIRIMLTEAAAETSEELMDKYFEDGELSNDELMSALSQGICEGDIVPVLCGSALHNLGITNLTDILTHFMPSPDRVKAPVDSEGNEVAFNADEPFSAFVFKTVVDPFVGKMSLFKVITGKFESGSTVYNTNHETNERVGHIYILKGDKQDQVDTIMPGDIGAVAKLQKTVTGDTLCKQGTSILYPEIEFPKPMIAVAIECAKEGDEDKVFGGLTRLNEEDPTFKVEKNLETNQTLLYGIGEMHIDVIGAKLKNKFKAGITTLERKIAYRETIKKTIEVEGKHKKQTGGHGQFGHVRIRFAPLDDISQRFEFEDKIVGGAVPKGYIPAVERGLKDNLTTGTLANYPLTGIKATLYDGSYHNVDSSEMAFKIAAGLALKKLDTAKPILLEPIMHIAVAMPDEYMGDIIGDLNRRRGRIMGMTPLKGGQIVEAEVPESEVFKYATDLRSMTHARGSYTLKFVRYEEVPSNIATKVIAAAHKEDEDK